MSWGWFAEIPTRKYFLPLPQAPAEPSTWCQAEGAAAPAQTAPLWVTGLRSDVGSGHSSAPCPGEPRQVPIPPSHLCHLIQGSPRPHILLKPRGHTRLPALSWLLGAQAGPGGSSRTPGSPCQAEGRRLPVAERGSAGCHGSVRPECGSSSAPRSRSRPSPGREPSCEEVINIC